MKKKTFFPLARTAHKGTQGAKDERNEKKKKNISKKLLIEIGRHAILYAVCIWFFSSFTENLYSHPSKRSPQPHVVVVVVAAQ